MVCTQSSCQTEPSTDHPQAQQGREIFDLSGNRPIRENGQNGPSVAPAWAVVLVAFRGDAQEPLAREALGRIQHDAALPDAYLDRRGEGWIIALGRHADPTTPDAQADLQRARGAELDGGRPFALSFLAPPPVEQGGAAGGERASGNPAYELGRAVETFGDKAALYTLQVGVYARADTKAPTQAELAEFRRLAEEGAAQLRREGELAFFYHGPNRSMVTVGIFNEADHDPRTPGVQSARLRQTKDRFPLNLLNGKGIRVRVRGVPDDSPHAYKLQESGLVAIPR